MQIYGVLSPSRLSHAAEKGKRKRKDPEARGGRKRRKVNIYVIRRRCNKKKMYIAYSRTLHSSCGKVHIHRGTNMDNCRKRKAFDYALRLNTHPNLACSCNAMGMTWTGNTHCLSGSPQHAGRFFASKQGDANQEFFPPIG